MSRRSQKQASQQDDSESPLHIPRKKGLPPKETTQSKLPLRISTKKYKAARNALYKGFLSWHIELVRPGPHVPKVSPFDMYILGKIVITCSTENDDEDDIPEEDRDTVDLTRFLVPHWQAVGTSNPEPSNLSPAELADAENVTVPASLIGRLSSAGVKCLALKQLRQNVKEYTDKDLEVLFLPWDKFRLKKCKDEKNFLSIMIKEFRKLVVTRYKHFVLKGEKEARKKTSPIDHTDESIATYPAVLHLLQRLNGQYLNDSVIDFPVDDYTPNLQMPGDFRYALYK
jgi:hypothetical protein